MGRVVTFLATGFYAGLSPVMPGTVGSLVGLVLFLPLQSLPPPLYLATVAFLYVAGVFLSQRAERDLGEPDSRHIVIDEIVGMLLTLFMLPQGWTWVVAAFLLFRLMDIVKPPPIRWVEHRLPGGWGIMTDDILAAVYANGVLQGLAYVLGTVPLAASGPGV